MDKKKILERLQTPKAVRWFWIILCAPVALILLLLLLTRLGAFGKLPTFEELENPKSNLATEIYSDDGEMIGSFFIQNRSYVDYNELSPALVAALISTEDASIPIRESISSRWPGWPSRRSRWATGGKGEAVRSRSSWPRTCIRAIRPSITIRSRKVPNSSYPSSRSGLRPSCSSITIRKRRSSRCTSIRFLTAAMPTGSSPLRGLFSTSCLRS